MTKTKAKETDYEILMNEFFKDVENSRAEVSKIKKELIEKQKTLFKSGSKLLFDKHPQLYSFGWTQYTPSFNDGDACYFTVNNDEPMINGVHSDEFYSFKSGIIDLTTDLDGYKDSEFSKHNVTSIDADALREMVDDVSNFIQRFDEDYYEDVYGNGVEVTVTPNKIITDDYDCGY